MTEQVGTSAFLYEVMGQQTGSLDLRFFVATARIVPQIGPLPLSDSFQFGINFHHSIRPSTI
jgi:hypothetical protein